MALYSRVQTFLVSPVMGDSFLERAEKAACVWAPVIILSPPERKELIYLDHKVSQITLF